MAEEWVWNAHNKAEAEIHSQREVKKAFGSLKEDHTELNKKFIISERECLSTLLGLKSAEAQAKDQC